MDLQKKIDRGPKDSTDSFAHILLQEATFRAIFIREKSKP
jgi:hypothetical protein